jgi:hypothetical protein
MITSGVRQLPMPGLVWRSSAVTAMQFPPGGCVETERRLTR